MPVATGTKTTSAFSGLLIASTARLGQSQHDEKPKAIMGTFCETFLPNSLDARRTGRRQWAVA